MSHQRQPGRKCDRAGCPNHIEFGDARIRTVVVGDGLAFTARICGPCSDELDGAQRREGLT